MNRQKISRKIGKSLETLQNGNWKKHGDLYVSNHAQGSDGWKQERTFLLTASQFSNAAGTGYTSQDDYLEIFLGLKEQTFSPAAEKRMAFGNREETNARNWYCSILNEPSFTDIYKGQVFAIPEGNPSVAPLLRSIPEDYPIVKTIQNSRTRTQGIFESGLIVPEWDTRLGCSLDGALYWNDPIEEQSIKSSTEKSLKKSHKMIEIKSPDKFPYDIEEYLKDLALNFPYPEGYRYHLPQVYWDQIQGCMNITGIPCCDYIVYFPNTEDRPIYNSLLEGSDIDIRYPNGKVYVQTIKRDGIYWNTRLYPKLKKFLDRAQTRLDAMI